MCLTIPGRVLCLDASDPVARTATVDFAGNLKRVNLLYLPEAREGDYVLVHAGFATEILPEAEALEALRYASEMSEQMVPPHDAPSRKGSGGGAP